MHTRSGGFAFAFGLDKAFRNLEPHQQHVRRQRPVDEPLDAGQGRHRHTAYRHNAGGNLTNVDYPNSADLTLGYDALSRLSTLADGVGTSSYSYASWGGLASEDGP